MYNHQLYTIRRVFYRDCYIVLQYSVRVGGNTCVILEKMFVILSVKIRTIEANLMPCI
jgi:hypothetical protein